MLNEKHQFDCGGEGCVAESHGWSGQGRGCVRGSEERAYFLRDQHLGGRSQNLSGLCGGAEARLVSDPDPRASQPARRCRGQRQRSQSYRPHSLQEQEGGRSGQAGDSERHRGPFLVS